MHGARAARGWSPDARTDFAPAVIFGETGGALWRQPGQHHRFDSETDASRPVDPAAAAAPRARSHRRARRRRTPTSAGRRPAKLLELRTRLNDVYAACSDPAAAAVEWLVAGWSRLRSSPPVSSPLLRARTRRTIGARADRAARHAVPAHRRLWRPARDFAGWPVAGLRRRGSPEAAAWIRHPTQSHPSTPAADDARVSVHADGDRWALRQRQVEAADLEALWRTACEALRWPRRILSAQNVIVFRLRGACNSDANGGSPIEVTSTEGTPSQATAGRRSARRTAFHLSRDRDKTRRARPELSSSARQPRSGGQQVRARLRDRSAAAPGSRCRSARSARCPSLPDRSTAAP